MRYRSVTLALAVFLASALAAAGADVSPKLTRAGFEKAAGSKGVVLLAVRWDRWWNCGGFENAQLRSISFDKLPSSKSEHDSPDVLLDDAPKLMTKPLFDNYALLVEPGEYGLSAFSVKVARTVNDVGTFNATRAELMEDGKSVGGSFSVGPGEIVYIGNFYLDCYEKPILWRYYSEGRDGFSKHMDEFAREFPFLNTGNAVYRLFATQSFGNPYELP
jgi:hypothetical protein